MTSAINYSAISTTYPVAGQDNDSQGFRDNFTAIQAGLAEAATELTALQKVAITTADLATQTTPVVNNMLGSTLNNGLFSQFNGVFFNGGTATSASININNGPAQQFTITGSGTLTFTNWPASGSYGVVRVILIGDQLTTHTTTFSTANAGTLRPATGWPGVQVSTLATASTPTTFTSTSNYATGYTLTLLGTTTYTGGITSPTVGMIVSGSGVPSSTYVTAVNTASFTGTISGQILTVTAIGSGTIGIGMQISGGTISGTSTYITSAISVVNGIGTYNVSANQTVSTATTISGVSYTLNNSVTGTITNSSLGGVGNVITLNSIANIITGTPLSLGGTLGGLAVGVYYVLAIPSTPANTVVIGQLGASSGAAATVTSTTSQSVGVAAVSNSITLGTTGKYEVIEAWTVNAGSTVFLKSIGEY
jgi:hypothetical protein